MKHSEESYEKSLGVLLDCIEAVLKFTALAVIYVVTIPVIVYAFVLDIKDKIKN